MEELKIKISNMEDKELKDNIIRYNNDKLNNINKSSYLNAFGAIISLITILDRSEEFDYLKSLSEVKLFKKYVDTAIKLINKSTCKKDLSQDLENAKNIRNELYDLLKIVKGYYIELSYVGNIVDYHGLILNSQDYDRDYNIVNTERIIKLIHDKLESHKTDYTMYNYIISQIIQFIPIRLTKDKYINIVENSIKRNLQSLNNEHVEDKINYYKSQWDSSLQYGYGLRFDKYFALIQNLKNKDIKNKSLSQLDNIAKDIISITDDINELYNFILIIGLTYNMIIVIFSGSENSLDEDILEIKEQWNNVLESREENNIKEFAKLNETKIREIETKTVAYIEEFRELNKEAAKRKNFVDNGLEEIFLYTKEILTYYNDYNLSNIDIILSKNNTEVSDEYLDEWVNSLTSYIKRSLKYMDNVERKVRMKKFLSLIELPFFSIKEFENYIRYSLNYRVSSSKETLFIIDNIIAFIQNIENKIEN